MAGPGQGPPGMQGNPGMMQMQQQMQQQMMQRMMQQQGGGPGMGGMPPGGFPGQHGGQNGGQHGGGRPPMMGRGGGPPGGPMGPGNMHHGPHVGGKRPLSDISNEAPPPPLVPGTLLQNESALIDIKEDGFFSGPYRQERVLVFEIEQPIEELETKEDLTVGDRVGKPQMCPWHQRKPRTDVCKHWLRSQCKKGDDCDYLHQYDMKRMPLCHFFADGSCTKDDCQFLHIRPEDKVIECPWYARGFCKHGPKCRKKHARKELCGSFMAGFCPKELCGSFMAGFCPKLERF
ncbi:hypothetical protein T484DRAFT_1819205 [Baffinella frigidus]|nr:hypothetical protein T484DRAFT_1819205 [Cryptophyta sp. CCMP2293]